MGKVFLTIAGTVVVLNILLLLLPDGKYEKYVRFTAGLIVLLTVFGSIFRLNPDHAALNFDKNAYTLENEGVLETARRQIAEKSIAEKIKEETGIETTVSVVLENDKIKSVHISGCSEKKDEVADIAAAYCDINRGFVVVQ